LYWKNYKPKPFTFDESQALIETVVAGEPISKEKLTSEEIKIHQQKNRSDSKPIQERKCHFD
jgi:hypothetical protein